MKLNTKPLSEIEIGIPVLVAGTYHAKVHKKEIKANKAGDGNNLMIMVKILDNPVMTHGGKETENKGQCVCTRHISLKPTPDYDPDQKVKELAVAFKHPPEQDFGLEDITEDVIMVKLSVRDVRKDEATGREYPISNEIDRFTPVSDDDTFTTPPFA